MILAAALLLTRRVAWEPSFPGVQHLKLCPRVGVPLGLRIVTVPVSQRGGSPYSARLTGRESARLLKLRDTGECLTSGGGTIYIP